MMNTDLPVSKILGKSADQFAKVIPFDLNQNNVVIFDFTSQNEALAQLDINDTDAYERYVFDRLSKAQSPVGIGRYNEVRTIYQKSSLFDSDRGPRVVHLGIDIWAAAGTPVFMPFDGKVHSFHNNNNYGDYGPTIIVAHTLMGRTFHTLYGHLALESLHNLSAGKPLQKGETIAHIGDASVNGTWPPHLHFQIIADMQGKMGDYPGVVTLGDRQTYLTNCPDPNLILQIERLN